MNVIYETDYGSDYLMHHGVKGQKWGVRRYQNANGSYTQRGRIRYFRSRASKKAKIEEKIDNYRDNAIRDASAGYRVSAERWANKHRKAYEKLLNMNDQDIAQETYNKTVDLKKQARIAEKIINAESRGKTEKVAKLQSKKQAADYNLSQTERRLKLNIEKGKSLVAESKLNGYKVITQPGYRRYIKAGKNALASTIITGAALATRSRLASEYVLFSEDPYVEGTRYKLKK